MGNITALGRPDISTAESAISVVTRNLPRASRPAGSPARFDATISTDVGFDNAQFAGLTGAETISPPPGQIGNAFQVAGIPGATLEGVSFVSKTDPIYLDAQIEGSRGVNIYFTGAHTGALETSSFNPVAFTSP